MPNKQEELNIEYILSPSSGSFFKLIVNCRKLQKNLETSVTKVTEYQVGFSDMPNKHEVLNNEYCMRAIIKRGLHTFYPLFVVHVCTVTFGLMCG